MACCQLNNLSRKVRFFMNPNICKLLKVFSTGVVNHPTFRGVISRLVLSSLLSKGHCMDKQPKGLLSLGMVVLSSLVLVLAFGTPGAGSRPLLPSLVPILKWPYGILFLSFQLVYCDYFRSLKGVLIILAVWIIAIPIIYLGAEFRWSPQALSRLDRAVIGASCLSALVIGIAKLKGKL